jgi:hypothetical protein
MLLYESKNGTVQWLNNERTVLKTFSGFIHGEELRAAFNAGYEQLKKYRGTKWLSDNRGLPTYKAEDIEWINTDWFPRMLKAGWKYWALVEPKTNVGLLVMKKFQFYVDQGIELEVFTTVEEALEWLKTRR